MIITLRQLQAIHYFFFAMGIFSLTNAIFLELGSLFSIIFISFYIGNSALAWYMAMVSRKRMKKYVVVQSLGFALRHVILTVLTVALTTMIWISGLIPDVSLLTALMTANYFVIFLGGMWYVITRTDLAKGLFTIYDNRVFKKSKEFIIKMRNAYHNYFGRQLVADHEIRDYQFGTVREVDENMIDAWRHRKKLRYAIECMGRVELSLARYFLGVLEEKIRSLKTEPPSGDNQRVIAQSEKEAEEELHDIMAYEKEYYKKTTEAELPRPSG